MKNFKNKLLHMKISRDKRLRGKSLRQMRKERAFQKIKGKSRWSKENEISFIRNLNVEKLDDRHNVSNGPPRWNCKRMETLTLWVGLCSAPWQHRLIKDGVCSCEELRYDWQDATARCRLCCICICSTPGAWWHRWNYQNRIRYYVPSNLALHSWA